MLSYKNVVFALVVCQAICSCCEKNVLFSTDYSTLISKSIFDLALKLQNVIIDEYEDDIPRNVVISPTSIAGALVIVMAGAVGNTYSELSNLLGFTSDYRTVSQYHQMFGKHLDEIQQHNSTQTHIASGLFLQEDFPVRPQYLDFIRNVYKSDVGKVNFKTQQERSLDFINRWTKAHTYGQITNILQKPLSTETKLLVVSALYFNGDWEVPFNVKYSKLMKFKPDITDSNKHVMVQMMINADKYLYRRSQVKQCELIAIPYKGGVTKFYIVKPISKSKSMLELHKELDADTIDTLIKEAKMENVIAVIPKMNISSRSDLIPALQRIGVKSLFSPTHANLGLLFNGPLGSPHNKNARKHQLSAQDIDDLLSAIPNPGLFVDDIEHEVKIDINEKGTEAAAATALATARSGITFRADEPFMFFIRDETTKLVTFSAIIFNPNE